MRHKYIKLMLRKGIFEVSFHSLGAQQENVL